MTFHLVRTTADRSPVPATKASGLPGVLQRAAAAVLRPSQLSLGRAGAGVTMLVQPRAVGRLLGLDRAVAPSSTVVVQMLGARELALGLGAFVALRRRDDRQARLWLVASLLCDLTDAVVVATGVIRGRVPVGTGAGLVTVAGTAVGVQAAALAES